MKSLDLRGRFSSHGGRYGLFAGLCLLLALSTANAAEVVDRVVAVVNNDVISLYDLNLALRPYAQKLKSLDYPPEKQRRMLFKIREDILKQLVDQKLAEQQIKRLKISVSDEQVDAAIERVKKASYYTDEDLREALAAQGLTMEAYRRRIRDQILRVRLVNREIKSKIAITPEDIKAYYEKHRREFAGQTLYDLDQVFLKVPEDADEAQRAAAKAQMEIIRQRLVADKAHKDHDKFLPENELSVGAATVQSLGTFKMQDLSPRLKKLLAGRGAGEPTPVLETAQGYQVIWIDRIVKKQGKSLEQAAPGIEEKLYNEVVNRKYRAWLEALRAKSSIKIIQ